MSNDSSNDEKWMRVAMDKCLEGIRAGQSPFGAAIVRDDQLIVAGHNIVLASTDITAHGEVNTIRLACRELGTIDLGGCSIYSSCEPCPMCFSACHWANLDRIVYGATIADATAAGFRELRIDDAQMKELGGSAIELTAGVLRQENVELFRLWATNPNRRVYGGKLRD